MDKPEFVTILSSAGSQIEASQIAQTLIDEDLAACISIVPGVTSLYTWKGKTESSFEVLMVIKALYQKFDQLKKKIVELHSYEVPEILMLPIIGGSERYLQWMRSETASKK